MERNEFIQGVSRALGRERVGVPAGRPSLRDKPNGIEDRAAQVRTRLAGRTMELTDKLSDVAGARGWQVRRVEGSESALDYIRELASGVSHVVRSDQDAFATVPIDAVLNALGIDVTVMTRGSGLPLGEQRAIAADAGLGITGADYAVAETGSVVLLAGPESSRLVSLVPPVHVAIVFPEQIIETLDDLLVLRLAAYYEGGMDMGSNLNLITGPSRTADIEQKLVVGVHGPKEAHLILVE